MYLPAVLPLVLAIVFSGCLGGNDSDPTSSPEPSTTNSGTGASTTGPGPSPTPPPPSQVLVDKSFKYPAFGMGAQANESFTVGATLRLLNVTLSSFIQCPTTYVSAPSFTLESPNGTRTSMPPLGVVGAGAVTVNCPSVGEELYLRQFADLQAEPGEWRWFTGGECTCRIELEIVSDPRTE